MDDIISSDDEWEESYYGNPPNTYTNTKSLFKPYLEAHEKVALGKRMNEAERNPQQNPSKVYSLVRTNTPLYLTSGYYLRRTQCIPTTTTDYCLVVVVRCKETWPQRPLLGLLRHTYCPRVATFKDLVSQVFKSGTMRVNGRTRYAYFEQIGKKKKTTIVVTTFTVVGRKTKGRVADMGSVQAYTKSNNA
ncbi:hypothetical protein Tco_0503638 [Tanacetum coccineum]